MEHKIFRGRDCLEQMKEFGRTRFQKFVGLSEETLKRKPDESQEDYNRRIIDAIHTKYSEFVDRRGHRVDFKRPISGGDRKFTGAAKRCSVRELLHARAIKEHVAHKESSDVKG